MEINRLFIYLHQEKQNTMDFKILSAKEYSIKLKATIQSTGKLGFTESTAKALELTKESGVKFAINDKEELFLINCKQCDEDAFKVLKGGDYFSANTKGLFDNLGLDYKANNIIFDMIKEDNNDMEVYKLLKREKPRK